MLSVNGHKQSGSHSNAGWACWRVCRLLIREGAGRVRAAGVPFPDLVAAGKIRAAIYPHLVVDKYAQMAPSAPLRSAAYAGPGVARMPEDVSQVGSIFFIFLNACGSFLLHPQFTPRGTFDEAVPQGKSYC